MSAAEEAFARQVRERLRGNFLAWLGHGLLGQTGMRLLNAPTLIPPFIAGLAGYDAAVGIARGVQHLGTFLSPVLGATFVEHRRRVLPTFLAFGALMRLQILFLALAAILLPSPWALFAAWLFMALFGFFLGIQGVVANVLVEKLFPVRVRGRLLGLRTALSGLFVFAVALLSGRYLVQGEVFGNGYAATFLLAFALTSCGLLISAWLREPDTPEVRERSSVQGRLRELPALLRSDPGFTRYFAARALATMGRMAVPFYVLYAGSQHELGGDRLGVLTGAFVLTQNTGNMAWGWLADRSGFRRVFLASLALWILSALALMAAGSFAAVVAVFAALGAGLGGFQMSAQYLVLEFGSRRNLPMRIAVANASSELVAALGAISGGVLVALTSYVAVFWTGIAFQLLALGAVALWVEDPRHRPAGRGLN